jgi:transposase
VVAAAESGEYPLTEIASIFNVGVTFIRKMRRLQRKGEDLAPRQGGKPPRLLQAAELKLLRAEVEARPDATLAELQTALADQAGVTASLPTICRALQQLQLARKKKPSGTVNEMKRGGASSRA